MNRFTALAAVLGSMAVIVGAEMIYRPLGLLALGSFLLSLAFASAGRKKKSQ
jgi:hypothetical protein